MTDAKKETRLTKKERELLFSDLSSRLKYQIIGLHRNEDRVLTCLGLGGNFQVCEYDYWFDLDSTPFKPYLRPLSSMTEEEKEELDKIVEKLFGKALDLDVQGKISGEDNEDKVRIQECFAHGVVTDWLNEHYLDYHELIPKGLALEAPENMYKRFGDMDVVVTSVEHKYKL